MREKDKLLRIIDWQHLEQHRIHKREDGRVRPDAERQGEHGDGGEAGIFEELTKSVAEVVHICDFWFTIDELAKSQIPGSKLQNKSQTPNSKH